MLQHLFRCKVPEQAYNCMFGTSGCLTSEVESIYLPNVQISRGSCIFGKAASHWLRVTSHLRKSADRLTDDAM